MWRRLKVLIVRRRFRAMMAPFEARIAEARRKHGKVRVIERERQAFLHACLRRAAGAPR